MADVRSERTLAALRAAIVELAAEHPLSAVTVSDVAVRAGINRATFYSHFHSPGELLTDVLRADLDGVRFRDEGTLSSEQIFRVALIGVAEHVQQFREIYRLALADPRDNTTHHILVQHFDESITGRLSRSESSFPDLEITIASRFLAHGLVGGIEAWLEHETVTQEELIESLFMSAPPWWFQP